MRPGCVVLGELAEDRDAEAGAAGVAAAVGAHEHERLLAVDDLHGARGAGAVGERFEVERVEVVPAREANLARLRLALLGGHEEQAPGEVERLGALVSHQLEA